MMSPAVVRKHIRSNPWAPGAYGKGVVTPTGTPYLYQTIEFDDLSGPDGWPSHDEALRAINAAYSEAGLVVIDPNGRFAFHYGGPRERFKDLAERVAAVHPDLEYRQDAYSEIY